MTSCLPEPPHAPLERDRRRILAVLRPEREALHQLVAEHVLLPVARELEHTPADRDHASIAVADNEARVRPRVVVLEQLEQEAEATARAADRLVGQPLPAILVDHSTLAVRADERGHPQA